MKALTWLALLLAVAACGMLFYERAQRSALESEFAVLQLAHDELDDDCEIRVAELRYQFERVPPSPRPLQAAQRLVDIHEGLRQRRHSQRDQALAELVIALELDAEEAELFATVVLALESEQRDLIGQTRAAGTELGDEYARAASDLRRQALLALSELLGPRRIEPLLDSRFADRLGLRVADPLAESSEGIDP